MSNQQESRAGSELPATANPSNPAVDAHGFVTGDYKWVPVRRRPREDGWSPRKMVAFVQSLADTGCVTLAAKEAGMSVRSAYALRRAPGAEKFAAAWEAAIGQAAHRLVDVAFDRAINGVVEPIYDREGNYRGQKVRHNDRLLMFLMRAHHPERYRTAHASFRRPEEPLPARPEPVARSIATLQPVPPAPPHLLLTEEELEHELDLADLAEGDLPHFYDDIPHGACAGGDAAPSDAFIMPPEADDGDPLALDPPVPFHPLPPQPQEPAPEPLAYHPGGGDGDGDDPESDDEDEDADEDEDEYDDAEGDEYDDDDDDEYGGEEEEEEGEEEEESLGATSMGAGGDHGDYVDAAQARRFAALACKIERTLAAMSSPGGDDAADTDTETGTDSDAETG